MTIREELAAGALAAAAGKVEQGPIAFLREFPVFVHLSDDRLAELASCLEKKSFSPEELVFRSGDPSDALYLVRSGSVSLFSSTAGKPTRLIARVGPGEMFGELGLVEDSDRTASARALEATTTLRLDRADFFGLIAADPSLALRFTLQALSRFSDGIARLLEPRCRKEARVYVGRVVRLEWGPGLSRHVSLENLSTGGMCLRGLPVTPLPDESVSGILRRIDGKELLRFTGRIAWQRNRAIGISFTATGPAHSVEVRKALRLVLNEESP